jgi:hypothetical protein
MIESTTVIKKPIALPCIAGVLTILSLFLIGIEGSVFPEMYRDFGIDSLPWNIRFISYFHWHWTLPFGCLLAAAILWGSRRWHRERSILVAGLAAALAVVLFFAFACISMMPVSNMSSLIGDAEHHPAPYPEPRTVQER